MANRRTRLLLGFGTAAVVSTLLMIEAAVVARRGPPASDGLLSGAPPVACRDGSCSGAPGPFGYFLSLPISSPITNSAQLLASIPSALYVQRYVPLTGLFQRWDGVQCCSVDRLIGGTPTGCAPGPSCFLVSPGEGYGVVVGAPASYTVRGTDGSMTIPLVAAGPTNPTGLHLLALPFCSGITNSLELMLSIGGGTITPVTYVQRYLCATDAFQVYTGRMGSGPVFPIVPGEAYFVKMSSTVNYTTPYLSTCPTVACPPEPVADAPFTILLKSRQFIPAEGIPGATLDYVTAVGTPRVHVLLQLSALPTPGQRQILANAGAVLLDSIPRLTWLASIPAANAAAIAHLSFVRAVTHLLPADKIEARILNEGVNDFARNADGSVRVTLDYAGDIAESAATALVAAHGGVVVRSLPQVHALKVDLPEAALLPLLGEDLVQWVEDVFPEQTLNDDDRQVVGAAAVQAPPIALDGSGVVIGEWDGGHAIGHPDLAGRVTLGDATTGPFDAHATHVAGTAIGDGGASASMGGVPQQWKGMAPNAQIISYDWTDYLAEYPQAVFDHGIDLATNSWGFVGPVGDYSFDSQQVDNLVGFSENRLPIVWAAGNWGESKVCKRASLRTLPVTSVSSAVTASPLRSTTEFVAWDEAGNQAYALSQPSGELERADLTTGSTSPVASLLGASGLALEPPGFNAFVGGPSQEIFRVNLATGSASHLITDPTLSNVKSLAINTTGTTLYACVQGPKIAVIDVASGTITNTIPLMDPTAPAETAFIQFRHIAVNSAGTRVFVTTCGPPFPLPVIMAKLLAVDLQSGAISVVAAEANPYVCFRGLAVDDSIAYVSVDDEGVSRVDLATGSVSQVTDDHTTALALDAAGQKLIYAVSDFDCIVPPATAKNTVTVGATNSNDDSLAWFSSRGPTDDGRVKPDLVAPGCQRGGDHGITSTLPDGSYSASCGTSMAAPTVSGSLALVRQRLTQLFGSGTPFASTLKVLVLHAASDLYSPGPDYLTGYGRLDVAAAIGIVDADGGTTRRIKSSGYLPAGTTVEYLFEIPSAAAPIKATLAWDDPGAAPNSLPALVNDLDLLLIDPSGGVHLPYVLDPAEPHRTAGRAVDELNNVEQVVVPAPAAGVWKARIVGSSIPVPPQSYSLVLPADDLCMVSPADTDGDGVRDPCDNCVFLANPTQDDPDQDGIGSVCDNCPLAANPSQANADGDGRGNACDPCPSGGATDPDGDGFICQTDNCPFTPNVTQADSDADGYGNACDCDPSNAFAWAAPGPLTLLSPAHVLVSWLPPDQPGATGPLTYDVVRGLQSVLTVSNGTNFGWCFASGIAATTIVDNDPVPFGDVFIYMVRARNSCGAGTFGSLARDFNTGNCVP